VTPRSPRRVSREAMQRAHPEREPVTAVCRRCGHQWESWAADRSAIRCPGCRYAFKLRRIAGPATGESANLTVSTQARTVVSPASVAALSPVPVTAVRPPYVAREPVDKAAQATDAYGDEYEPDYDLAVASVTAAQIQAEGARVAAAIQRCHATGRPQRATGPPEMIQRLSAGVASISADFPYIRQRVEPCGIGALSLTIWVDREALTGSERRIAIGQAREADRPLMDVMLESARESGTVVGAAVVSGSEALKKIRAGRAGRRRSNSGCDYCNAQAGYNTQGIYLVRSPSFRGERRLCARHAAQESAVPGAVLEAVSA